MIRINEVIISTHEFSSSLTPFSGLIFRNELGILVPIEFAEIFAILFQYNYGNNYYTFTSSLRRNNFRRRYYNYTCIFNLIFKSTTAERGNMCRVNVTGYPSIVTLKDIIMCP